VRPKFEKHPGGISPERRVTAGILKPLLSVARSPKPDRGIPRRTGGSYQETNGSPDSKMMERGL